MKNYDNTTETLKNVWQSQEYDSTLPCAVKINYLEGFSARLKNAMEVVNQNGFDHVVFSDDQFEAVPLWNIDSNLRSAIEWKIRVYQSMWTLFCTAVHHESIAEFDNGEYEDPFVYQQDENAPHAPDRGKWFWYNPAVKDSDVGPFDTEEEAEAAMEKSNE